MKDKFLIGELADIFNISADTLRHYDKINLLKPDQNEKNKYRYYSIRKFFLLSRILFLKNLNIPLGGIKEYLNDQNTDHLLKLLRKKEQDIDREIEHLNNMKLKIASKVNLIHESALYMDQMRICHLPERKGVFLDIENVEDDAERKRTFSAHESFLKVSSWLIEGQIYTALKMADILNREYLNYKYFVEIVSPENTPSTQITIIPEMDYLCLIFRGPYSEFIHAYDSMLSWIDEHGYRVAGDAIEKNIMDYGFTSSEEEYISEIQIPVV
ncbi:MAG: MerR family transcriptional regulator [Clostridia bacterium]|nr:MerR family transcriptional regulator [Clostridia bacterium]